MRTYQSPSTVVAVELDADVVMSSAVEWLEKMMTSVVVCTLKR